LRLSENRHLTGRVNKHQIDQLEKISQEEKIDRSSALRKVLDLGLDEYNKRKALEEYRRGRISIGKAASLAKVSTAEFYKILESENISIRIDMRGIEEGIKSDSSK
jgi:predicted HTH domain antitoxin